MALKILSVLGTTDYESGMHSFNNEEILETQYVQDAIIKMYEKEIESKDMKFCIFLTKLARQRNFEKLERILVDRYPKLEIVPIELKDGNTEEELWEIFEVFYHSIEENDEIVIDITHSLRHLPMELLVVVNYAKVLKNITVKGIYYGAFEVRYKKDGKTIIPIHNITEFNSLLEWSYGANTFINYGNVLPIHEAYKKLQRKMGQNWNKEHSEFTKFMNALSDFSNCIYIPRGTSQKTLGTQAKNASKKSTQVALNNLNSAFQNMEDFNSVELKQIKPIINKVKNSVDMFDPSSTFAIGLQSVKWSMDKNLIPQAYTILSETIKTYVCNIYSLDDEDYDDREKIVATSLVIKGKKLKQENWKVKEEHIGKVKNIIESIDDRIPELYDKVGARRNDISHYGLTKDKISYEALVQDINKIYEEFLKIIDIP